MGRIKGSYADSPEVGSIREMGFVVELRDETSRVLRRFNDQDDGFANSLPPFHDTSFPLLRLIDPYGDTVFNSLQMQAVIPELERLREVGHFEKTRSRVLELAHQCADGAHLFLVFIGD